TTSWVAEVKAMAPATCRTRFRSRGTVSVRPAMTRSVVSTMGCASFEDEFGKYLPIAGRLPESGQMRGIARETRIAPDSRQIRARFGPGSGQVRARFGPGSGQVRAAEFGIGAKCPDQVPRISAQQDLEGLGRGAMPHAGVRGRTPPTLPSVATTQRADA